MVCQTSSTASIDLQSVPKKMWGGIISYMEKKRDKKIRIGIEPLPHKILFAHFFHLGPTIDATIIRTGGLGPQFHFTACEGCYYNF